MEEYMRRVAREVDPSLVPESITKLSERAKEQFKVVENLEMTDRQKESLDILKSKLAMWPKFLLLSFECTRF